MRQTHSRGEGSKRLSTTAGYQLFALQRQVGRYSKQKHSSEMWAKQAHKDKQLPKVMREGHFPDGGNQHKKL